MFQLFLLLTALLPAHAGPLPCAKAYVAIQAPAPELRGAALVNATYKRLAELAAAPPKGVTVKVIGESDGLPIHLVHVASPDPSAPRVFISSGVHGDEPVGVTTAMRLLEDTIRQRRFDLTYVPMANPGGLRSETRYNLRSLDINRSFASKEGTEAAAAIKKALEPEKFDVAVDLHGAITKKQFFLISAKEAGARADEILSSVPAELLLPSTSGTYPGFAPGLHNPEQYRMIFPGSAVSVNEGTLKDFLAARAPRAYTLEYPGAIDLPLQHEWNYRILNSILETARKE